jgi:hypothetical protein
MESRPALTQLMGSLIPHQLSVQEMNQTKTGIQLSSGTFKGMGYRKIIHEIFKWSQYQP